MPDFGQKGFAVSGIMEVPPQHPARELSTRRGPVETSPGGYGGGCTIGGKDPITRPPPGLLEGSVTAKDGEHGFG